MNLQFPLTIHSLSCPVHGYEDWLTLDPTYFWNLCHPLQFILSLVQAIMVLNLDYCRGLLLGLSTNSLFLSQSILTINSLEL